LKREGKNKYCTIRKMGEMLRVSTVYYCKTNSGQRNYNYLHAIKIAEVFKMKPDELF